MFCPNCGTKIMEGVFCPSCGTRVENEGVNVNVTSAETAAPETTAFTSMSVPNADTAYGKKLSTRMIVRIVALAVVLIAGILVVKGHKTTVKLDKYISVEYDGYNGYGTARTIFDKERFEKDYDGKIKLNKRALKQATKKGDYLDFWSGDSSSLAKLTDEYAMDIFESAVRGSLDKTNELSNGDELVYRWKCEDEEIEKFFKCKVKYKDIKFKVKGLKAVGTFNPFDAGNDTR